MVTVIIRTSNAIGMNNKFASVALGERNYCINFVRVKYIQRCNVLCLLYNIALDSLRNLLL